MKIGFIGLGHMGFPMACNLINAGFAVHVYDVNFQAIEDAVKQGAVAEKTVSGMAKQCDVMITMVQTGEQVRDICLGVDGFFSHVKPSTIYIDCSSIDITSTRTLHQAAEKHGIAMLDAPVSGGVAGAKAHTLTIMVGGNEANFQRALPILQALGKKVVHAGHDGSGQAAKICNNLLLGISMIGVCEAFNLADKLGLEAKKFFEISSNASGQCWSMTSYCPVPGVLENVPSSNSYQPGFMSKMMLKDLKLGQHAAQAVHAAIPLGEMATKLYEAFVDQGLGEIDFSGIYQHISHADTAC